MADKTYFVKVTTHKFVRAAAPLEAAFLLLCKTKAINSGGPGAEPPPYETILP